MYGIVYTTQGLELLASLGAGETLTITRCMVGTGVIGSEAVARALTDLVQPLALATSNKPIQKDNQCSLIIEYRNDLNGGLEQDVEITEFGVWAQTGSNAEVLLMYAGVDDHPMHVPAYTSGGAIDTRRWPISITISDECPVVLGYPALYMMTAEDVAIYCMEVVLQLFLDEVDKKIATHNISQEAHPDIRALIAALRANIATLQLQVSTDVTGNMFTVMFESLDGLIVSGVWNAEMARMEF